MKLLKVISVVEAIQQVENHLWQHYQAKTEIVPLQQAYGRISAKTILSPEVLPNFTRSTVDGYAIRHSDSLGSSDSIPSILRCVEEIGIGQVPKIKINPGECAYVPTGGMLPVGADAVIMIEYTEVFNHNQVLMYRPVALYENVIQIGDDIAEGAVVVHKGQKIDIQSIGLCAGVGISGIEVYKKLRASIISTGNEVIPVEQTIQQGQVHDVNRSMIAVALINLGIDVVDQRLIPDNEEELTRAVHELKDNVDVIFVSGGSSQGDKDYTEKAFDKVGNPGVWSHGLAIKPGKPTILGASGSCLLFGLPGHPVSALAVFSRVFQQAFIQTFGQPPMIFYAQLETNVIASAGKETIIFLHVYPHEQIMKAKVLYTKSGLIATLKDANAYLVIPGNLEGYQAGTIVEVTRL